MPPPNDTPPKATQSYNKPGTPMTDNIHLFFRPPKETGGFYTIEDIGRNVLACGRTFDEAAVKWHQIDTQKVLIEKLNRQGGFAGINVSGSAETQRTRLFLLGHPKSTGIEGLGESRHLQH
jgi:hypothetical protein